MGVHPDTLRKQGKAGSVPGYRKIGSLIRFSSDKFGKHVGMSEEQIREALN